MKIATGKETHFIPKQKNVKCTCPKCEPNNWHFPKWVKTCDLK
jgi:hypothetical protein